MCRCPGAPPQGVTWTLYDTDGNELYPTTGVYEPGASSAAYPQTTYQLFEGNTVTLNGTNISCTATPPSPSLPCATINADGVVTQLGYDQPGDLTSSSTPDGNGARARRPPPTPTTATASRPPTTAPDGNLSGANAGNYTTDDRLQRRRREDLGHPGRRHRVPPSPRAATSYGYDADGNRTTVNDARGYTTTTAYNADDQPTLVTDPDGNATLTCYDGDGNVAQTVPPAGVAANSLTAGVLPDRPTRPDTATGWPPTRPRTPTTPMGNKTAMTTPAPAGQTGYETTTYTYDGDGQPHRDHRPAGTSTAEPPDQVTVDTYNTAGQLPPQTTGYGTPQPRPPATATTRTATRPRSCTPTATPRGTAPCETSSPWVVSSRSYPDPGRLPDHLQPTTRPASWSPRPRPRPPRRPRRDHHLHLRPGREHADQHRPQRRHHHLDLHARGNLRPRSPTPARPPTRSASLRRRRQQTGMTDATGYLQLHLRPVRRADLRRPTAPGRPSATATTPTATATGITYPLPATATWAATRHRDLRLRQRRPADLGHRLQRPPDHHHQHRRRPAHPPRPSARPATPSPPPTTPPTPRRRSR